MVKVTPSSSRNTSRRFRTAAPLLRKYSPYSFFLLFLVLVLRRGYISLLHIFWACPASINVTENDYICFVTCIFGDAVEQVDRPANVEWFASHWCKTQFMLVTNLPNLPAPGWTKIVQDVPTTGMSDSHLHTKNHIIQSREAKFLAWKILPVQRCGAVFYMDGYLQPRFSWSPSKFRAIVQQVQSHPWGLSQVKQKYFNGLEMTTILNNLIRDRKDTVEHVNMTLSWLREQDDYQDVMTYYLNKYFAYDPNNEQYRKLSSWFWEQYTAYGGLWRDQPLWAYALYHFNCTPGVMTTKGTITKGGDLFQTGGKIGWDQHTYVAVDSSTTEE